ncbi:tyrosine-type recombinase/integrase [Arthrobacter cupressi]|uniref:Phage integrase family protein n=1 Tax=Arthrobacter cupressi TaxID=1045773 RepID=A0A1G8SQL6_9MICC|nr:tyrosine-type recombinase/integrase [Arthrobacter cupressi]NYD78441.1 integrase [Arthrobacter cupressi]SDJ31045.1 Phage integrase family protein [Arthrobacter cupressi]
MSVRKLDWAVTYSAVSGKRLRNEYDTEARARDFAGRQAKRAHDLHLEAPVVSRLKPRRWEAGYQDPQGKWKTRRFATKEEATEFVREQCKSVRSGTYIDPKSAAGMTVADLYGLWIDRITTMGASGRRPATPKTVQGYEWLYSRMIEPRWGRYPLSSVTYAGVGRWTQTMKGVDGTIASPDTRARASKQFSRMLDYAVGLRILALNPAQDSAGGRDYVPQTNTGRESVYLTRPQLERLATCSGQYELLVRFTGLTGLRWGEVTALTVGDLDLGPRPCVSVSKAFSEVNGRLVLGDTKGHAAREVPLPASLAGDLLALAEGKPAQTLLFPSSQGLPMRNSNFTRRYYEPARRLASTSVSRMQTALGITETRRGLAVFGDLTLAELVSYQYHHGLPAPGVVGPETWGALATEAGISDEQRDLLHRSAGIRLAYGDMDFRPPVFHDLRHTAVSLYLSVTKNVKHVQRIAGHKDGTTTINTYGELFDDDFFKAAAGLDSLI